MDLTRRISFTVVVAVLSVGPAVTMAAEGSFKVTTGERQLFLDDFGIETIRGLDRRMHQPLKMGAVIRPDKFVGEEAVQMRGAPLWDPQEKIFKLWISGTRNPCRTSPDNNNVIIFHFFSNELAGNKQFKDNLSNNLERNSH